MRGGRRHKNDRGKGERTEMRAREENEILGDEEPAQERE